MGQQDVDAQVAQRHHVHRTLVGACDNNEERTVLKRETQRGNPPRG
jgi:hypothetical protein